MNCAIVGWNTEGQGTVLCPDTLCDKEEFFVWTHGGKR